MQTKSDKNNIQLKINTEKPYASVCLPIYSELLQFIQNYSNFFETTRIYSKLHEFIQNYSNLFKTTRIYSKLHEHEFGQTDISST